MKKQSLYALAVTFLLLNSVLGCSPKADDPQAQPAYVKALLGRWEVTEATVYKRAAGEADGTLGRILGTFRSGLAYVFYDNKSYDGCIQSGSDWDNAGQSGAAGTWTCSTNKTGRWELTVGKESAKSGDLDDDSFITLNAPDLKEPQVYKFYGMDEKNLLLATLGKKDISGDETWMSLKLVKK